MVSPIIKLSFEGFWFILHMQCADFLCNECYVTRLDEFNNRLITDYEIWNRSVTNQGVCFRLCYKDLRCVSFQHNTDFGICRGMAARFKSPSDVNTSLETGNRLYARCTAYIGCYEDKANRMFPYGFFNDPNMTTEFCLDYCISNGHIYAATQATQWCFCGDSLPGNYREMSNSECNLACVGDGSQTCGGDMRNSVYVTVPQQTIGCALKHDRGEDMWAIKRNVISPYVISLGESTEGPAEKWLEGHEAWLKRIDQSG